MNPVYPSEAYTLSNNTKPLLEAKLCYDKYDRTIHGLFHRNPWHQQLVEKKNWQITSFGIQIFPTEVMSVGNKTKERN